MDGTRNNAKYVQFLTPSSMGRSAPACRIDGPTGVPPLPPVLWPAITLVLVVVAAAAAANDPAVYRTGRMDPRISNVPADLQRSVFAQPEQSLEPLVRALLDGVTDEFLRVKILHDWLAENIAYDVHSYFSGTRADTTWPSALGRRTAVCQGYCTLLEKMCLSAGITCTTVSGYGRGYGFAPGQTENVANVNHAWNAVQIQGRWYLVDVTWDTGHVDGRVFRKHYSTAHLFSPPEQFIYAHFPTDPRWQLIDPPCTAQQFTQLPYLQGRFFEHGLRLVTPVARFAQTGSAVRVDVETPADVLLSARLKSPDGTEQSGRTLIQREGNRCQVLATFPQPGRWNLQLFSKHRSDPGMFGLAGVLELESREGTPYAFPETYTSYASMEGFIDSPLYVPLATGQPLTFKIRLRGAEQVHLVIGDRWLPMQPVSGQKDMYKATAEIPAGAAVRLMAKEAARGSSHWTLVDFTEKK